MKQKLLQLGVSLTALFAPVTSVMAGPWDEGLSKAQSESELSEMTLSEVIILFMKGLLYILSGLCVIAFSIAGILYLTSAGNEDRMEQAKRAMMYSVIGIVVGLVGLVIANAATTLLGQGEYKF